MAWIPSPAAATVILATDRTVSGTTASNITWTTNGVSNPDNLTDLNTLQAQGNGNLFDTVAAQGYFAPANNAGNGGIWQTSFTVSVDDLPISLTDVDLGRNNFEGVEDFKPRSVACVIL